MPFFSKREPEEDVIKLALTLGTESNRATGAAGMKKPHGFALVQRRASALFGMGKSEAELGADLVAKLDKVIADWQTGEYTYTVDEKTKQEVDCAEVVKAEPYIGGKRLAVLQVLVGPIVANAIVQKAVASGSDAFVDNTDKLIELAQTKIGYTWSKNINAKPTTDLASKLGVTLDNIKDTDYAPLTSSVIELQVLMNELKECTPDKIYEIKAYLSMRARTINLAINKLLEEKDINKLAHFDKDGLNPGITRDELLQIKALIPTSPDKQHVAVLRRS